MKQFPRIYSLSTLGLIHHQEFDYKFHPFRTDFIGESGAGKSMIADLIQLIFVGSDAFESATKATGERKPSGMVLDMEDGKSTNIGYAFLNIETAPGKYLVIGAYIESSSQHTQLFIIQAGYDFSAITPLSKPLTYNDFLQDDDMLPIDLLKEYMAKNELFCESWQKIKKYHEILFREKILPLDLAANDKMLKDYAGILQSFSRGKTLDTQKSSSLKSFLFGSEKAKEIMDQFRQAVKDFEDTVGEYGSNLREIERVTEKQKALLDLKLSKDERDQRQLDWLSQNYFFRNQEADRLHRELMEDTKAYINAEQYFEILKELFKNEVGCAKNQLPELLSKKKQKELLYEMTLPAKARVETVNGWLDKLQCDIVQLEIKYKEHRNNKILQATLSTVSMLLREKNVYKDFEAILVESAYINLHQYLQNEIELTKNLIAEKELLKDYADINNPQSLANWAFQQKRVFTKEEESVILNFQKLPRNKPSNKGNYLPDPSQLFTLLEVTEKDTDGFWINMKGIRTYVRYVQKQILDSTDPEKIQSYFLNYTNTISKDIEELNEQLKKHLSIQEILAGLDNPTLTFAAFSARERLQGFKIIQSLDINEDTFSEHLDAYNKRVEIEMNYCEAKKYFEEISAQVTLTESLSNTLSSLSGEMDKKITLPTEISEFIVICLKDDPEASENKAIQRQNIAAEMNRAPDKGIFLQKNILTTFQSIKKGIELSDKKRTRDIAQKDKDNSISKYQQRFGNLPAISDIDFYLSEPKQKEQDYNASEQQYFSLYKGVIRQYIPSESFKFEQAEDFVGLAKSLLPEAFHGVVLEDSESAIIEIIANFLKRINDKNRQLNNRKIQKIKDLLDELDIAITNQVNMIRRIDNFLKSGKNISGGYKARLKSNQSTYPRGWMENFRQILEDEIGNVTTLSEKLSEKIDLEQMVKSAFYHCGGSQSADTAIHKLLDPSSYYDMSFTMESESGRINKGSSGQTYAAIALLCIARLSVMSQDEGGESEPAVRVMPIDEAEGLGSNYDMLHDIAQTFDYQIISLSIGPVGKFEDGQQYIYMLHKNMQVEYPINYTPMAILCERDLSEKLLMNE